MERNRVIEALVVVVGLALGFSSPSWLGRQLTGAFPLPTATSVAPATATVSPAVTFTPVPPTVLASGAATTPEPPPATTRRVETPVAATPTRGSEPAPPPPGSSGTPITASPTPPLVAPSPTPVVYIVRSGDTIDGIGALFGISADSIIAANHLADPNTLSVGQKLIIPPK